MKRRHRTTAATALLLVISTNAYSQSPPASEKTPALPAVTVTDTRDKPLDLDQPAAIGSRLGTTIRETPASVEVITQETLRERGKRTLTEAVEAATGMTSLSTGSTPNVAQARGFVGNGVRLLYDGLVVGGAQVVGRPGDTFNLDRIEVLRGPASVLYGEGAIGGAINYVTKMPTRKAEPVDLMLGIGSHDARRFGIGTGGVLAADRAYFRLDASGSDTKSDLHGHKAENRRITGTLLFDLAPTLSLSLHGDHMRDSQNDSYWGTPLNNGRIDERLRNVNYNNLTDNRFQSRNTFLRANLEWRPNAAWELRNTAYYYKSYRDFRNVESYVFNPAAGTVTRSSFGDLDHDHKVYGDRIDALHKGNLFGLQNRLAFGADFTRTDFFSARNGFPGTDTVDAFNPAPLSFNSATLINRTPARDVNIKQWAIFAEDQLSLTQQLKLVAGVRQDKIDTHFLFLDAGNAIRTPSYSPTSVRGGVVYDVTPGLTLYGQYTNATEPVSSLLLLSAVNTTFDLTKGRQVEIGAKASFLNGRGEATVALYDIEKKNVLTRDPNNPALNIAVGKQSSRGVEIAAGLLLSPQWRIDGNLALLNAQFDDFSERVGAVLVSRVGNVPRDVPERIANLGVRFMPNAQLYLGAYGRHVGRRFTDNANTIEMPAYTVLDLTAGYRVTKRIDIALWVRNATDKLYALSSDGGGGQQVLLGASRTVEAVLIARF